MKLWILHEDLNEYDQPNNNLAAIWSEKPSYLELAAAMGLVFPGDDASILQVVKCAQGEEVKNLSHTRYRLREIEEGILSEAE